MDYNFDDFPAASRCTRLTNAKTQCTYNAELYAPACSRHSAEDELKLSRLLQRAWRGGLRAGTRQSTDHLEKQIVDLKNEIRELQRDELRLTVGADQIIEVDGFAYRWGGLPLEVGEEVILPANPRRRKRADWVGKVTAIGTRHPGFMQYVVARTSDSG